MKLIEDFFDIGAKGCFMEADISSGFGPLVSVVAKLKFDNPN
ncbi:hypothetical protein EDC56_1134 [Sinobacterium caligoides]|uniref:Uncharacterized protein n=1 Tax=Sinobacterium caligoides TaxID=933926 RepID=A0A3N2E106_9GAMM|nr:hypothetical protein [Sinobacterium caligoides]ROS05592.1 hypothetical protein EDC56_1134 [Sinobacterium caligoides]